VPAKKLHSSKCGKELYFLVMSIKGLYMMDWMSNYVRKVEDESCCWVYLSFSPFMLYYMLLVLLISSSLGFRLLLLSTYISFSSNLHIYTCESIPPEMIVPLSAITSNDLIGPVWTFNCCANTLSFHK
jgi:hypothetical protein